MALSLAYIDATGSGLELKLADPNCVHHHDAVLIIFSFGLAGLLSDFDPGDIATFLEALARAVRRDSFDMDETPRQLFWRQFKKGPKMVVPAKS